MQSLTQYRTISILGLAVAGILFAVYFMPASLVDDRTNVVISMLLIGVAMGASAWAGYKAWPRSGKLRPYDQTGQTARMNPLEEPVQEGHLEDVPEPPADHVIRGYGAMNPTEGDLGPRENRR